MNPLVIIPTYNERENIEKLVPILLGTYPNIQILVVDDSSPDGTADAVQLLQPQSEGRLHLLTRPGKLGLAKAYLAGFEWGLSREYDPIVEMDADFSHRPADLAVLLKSLETNDFVVGSRWIQGGGVKNWSWTRKVFSLGGSLYARSILGSQLKDLTGGFNGWRAKVLKAIDLSTIQSQGYSFQIELKYRADRQGFHGIEVPILFDERLAGQSKMSASIVLEAMFRVWSLRNV